MPSHFSTRSSLSLFCLGAMLFNVEAFRPALGQALTGWPNLSIVYTAGTMIGRDQAQLLYSDGVLIAWVGFLADSGRGTPAAETHMAESLGRLG